MASPTNSSRMRRFSHTTQLRKHNSSIFEGDTSEMVKLPALRAINKSIKYNDLSFATNRDLSKLRKQPEQIENIEQVAAHHSFVTLRKKYDSTNRERQETQKRVADLQAKRDKYLGDKNRMTREKVDGGGQVSKLQAELSQIKGKLENGQTQQKVMLSMIERLKKDKVVYDLRKFNYQKDLKKIQKYMKNVQKQSANMMEEEDKTLKFYAKYTDHIEAQKKQRDEHVENVSRMLMDKQDLLQNSQIRRQEMKMISVATQQDKDTKQKNWYHVHLCHRFVQKMLRDKMTREMMKFNTVEMSFKQIKTATGVSTGDDLVKKYLNKENTYGELLGKISDDQREIAVVKVQHDQLIKQHSKLKRQRQVLTANKTQTKDLSKEEKQLQYYSQKAVHCQKHHQNLIAWVDKGLKKFAKIEGNQKKNQQSQLNLIQKLKLYLQRLQASSQLQQLQDKSFDVNGTKASQNIRINLGQNAEHNDKTIQNNNEQGQFLDGERYHVLRNNEKFMRQLRIKIAQQKKAEIEAMPKKKPVVEEKPKPPVEMPA